MSATPAFAVTPRLAAGQTSATLDTVRNATGSATGLVTLITGAATGTRLNHVRVINVGVEGAGAPTAGVARFFLVTGTSYYLVSEVALAATAPTSSAAGARYDVPELVGVLLPDATWSLRFGVSTAGTGQDQYVSIVEGADL